MATMNAASRLRNDVLKVPHTVLLISPGHPDKVVRFNRAPDALTAYRTQKMREINPNFSDKDFKTVHTEFDLGNGPQAEAWNAICDEVKRQSRRDVPTPQPEEVAPDSQTDWSLGPEEVPVVEFQDVAPVPAEQAYVSAAAKLDKRTKAYKESQKAEA